MIKKYDPDVIYTSSSPYSVHLIGWALHRLTSKPWVADWRDLWTHAISWQGPTQLHALFNRWIERQEWSNATITVTHSNGHRRLIQRDLPELPADRLATVLMGYDPDEFDAIEAMKYENFTMLYAGTFYGIPKSRVAPEAIDARMRFWAVDRIFDRKGIRYLEEAASPKYMMQALCKALVARPDLSDKIRVHFLGFPRPENIEYINHLGLDGIVQHIGQVPFTECVSRMKGAHVLLLVMVPSENGRSDFVPSKVPEYLGAQQPILAMIPESEVGEMINEIQAGIVVDARDVDGASDAILNFYKCYEDGNLALESKPSTLNSLTWSHLAEQMVDILNRAKESVAQP
jgi:glycosyltransferase involved in cell wall biosynthesis